jgi:Uma2 family endonuclease
MTTADTAPMTAEEFLALPDDGKQRWLINGQLREKDDMMTYRNRFHSWTVGRITHLLWKWLDDQPQPHGAVYSGEVGCVLRKEPDTIVGIDVAYFSHGVLEGQTNQTTLIHGVPLLAVEVLSPSDKHEEITEKVRVYLECGVQAVWIVDPYFKTVQVHRAEMAPQTFNVEQSLTGGQEMPGLEIAVADLFSRGP